MTDTPLPSPTSWEETTDEQNSCRIYQRGRHRDGTFIRVYVPNRAADPSQPLRAVLYLHGFALCPPAFYDAHLRLISFWCAIPEPRMRRGIRTTSEALL